MQQYMPSNTHPGIITTPKTSSSPGRDDLTASLLGQPPTDLDHRDADTRPSPGNHDDDNLGELLQQIHGSVEQSELDLILKEQPDIQEFGLMEGLLFATFELTAYSANTVPVHST